MKSSIGSVDHSGTSVDCLLRLELLIIYGKWYKTFKLAVNIFAYLHEKTSLIDSRLNKSKSFDLGQSLRLSKL